MEAATDEDETEAAKSRRHRTCGRTVALTRKRAKARAAVRAIERDDRLRRPQNPYFLWLNDNRERIIGMLGKGGAEVTKKGSQMWKELSEQERKPYEEKALKAKDARLAYLQTPEGVEALKAFETAKADVITTPVKKTAKKRGAIDVDSFTPMKRGCAIPTGSTSQSLSGEDLWAAMKQQAG